MATVVEKAKEIGVTEFKRTLSQNLKDLSEIYKDHCYVDKKYVELAAGTSNVILCNYSSGPKMIHGWAISLPKPPISTIDATFEQSKGCIFGRALANMGVDPSSLDGNIEEILVDTTGPEFAYQCRLIQEAQDSGSAWGELPLEELT